MWTTENMPDQSGKTIIVTGANIGIGYETTLALYKAGAHVIMACRSLEKAETAAEAMKQEKGSGSLESYPITWTKHPKQCLSYCKLL